MKDNFMIIIKDTRDKETMSNVIGVIDMLIKKRGGKTIARMVDEDKPDMKVVVIRTTFRRFHCIREIIETMYPGFCGFKRV